MVKCPDCGRYNHQSANICTKCGKSLNSDSNVNKLDSNSNETKSRSHKNKGILYGITALGVVGVILLIIISFVSFSPDPSSTINYIDNETHPEAANVIIISVTPSRDSIGNYILNGTVQNNNSFGVAFVEVVATGYDDKGNVVSTDYTYAHSNETQDTDLSPECTAEFSIYLKDPNNKIVKYSIRVLDADKSLYQYDPDDSTANSSSSSSSSSNDFSGGYSGTGVSCTACDSLNTVLLSESTSTDDEGITYWDTYKCKNCGNVFTEPYPDSAYSTTNY